VRRLAAALVAVAVLLMIAAPVRATHPRPKGATPITLSLVPFFTPCEVPDRTHGAPLAFPSCASASGPRDTQPGTPDVNTAVAKQIGRVRFDALPGPPGPPESSDVYTALNISDVRCVGGNAGPCPSANANGGPDYPGEFQYSFSVRLSDNDNSDNGTSHPVTVSDFPFSVVGQCQPSADLSIGATCEVATTFNAVLPGAVKETQRTIWEIGAVTVIDGGADQKIQTADNFPFAVQGIFIP
jgi:hypothetical protein